MNPISFVIPVEPKSLQFSGKRLMIRAGKPMFFKTSKASSYQATITLLSRKYAPKQPLEGPIRVDFIFILALKTFLGSQTRRVLSHAINAPTSTTSARERRTPSRDSGRMTAKSIAGRQ
jgi:hypothetical protein